jgi:uncharacterized FlaG/YvyC family protein
MNEFTGGPVIRPVPPKSVVNIVRRISEEETD